MVLVKVELVPSKHQSLFENIFDVLGFTVFHFEQMAQFLFGLVYTLLEGLYVFELFFKVYRLLTFFIFHEKKYNLVNLITFQF